MIRLLLLLSAAIFITLQIGGEEHGQKRLGLAPRHATAQIVPAPQPQEEPLVQDHTAAVIAANFTPTQPLIRPQLDSLTAPSLANLAPSAMGDVQYVKGRAVNVRSGPSTGNPVVGKLNKGEAVTVAWIEPNGWARIRIEGDGVEGYMALDFLTKTAP